MKGWPPENRRKKTEKNKSFMFLKLIFFGGLASGKSAAKKTEKIYVLFFKTYIFRRACHGKIGGKKNGKNISFMFLKLKFLEGWSLESRRQKKMNKIYVL